jgi:hypothetical protein
MELRAARRRGSVSSAEIRPQPLMQLAVKLSYALAELDADLRAGGFGQNYRGLAGELYASFTATIIATQGTEAEATAWTIGHTLAMDLFRSGARRGALALLEGLVEFGAGRCHPQILARLTNAAEAIDQELGRRRRTAARTDKVSDGPPAAAKPLVQAPRGRYLRGGVVIAAAATALVSITLYLLVTHDGNLIRYSPSMRTSAATLPSDASLANASRSMASTPNVPMAIGSPDKAAMGAPAMGTAGTAADAAEKSPPRGQSQFLSPEEVRYAKARQDQLTADAIRNLASRAPKAGTPLLDLKTRNGAAAVQTKLKALGYYHQTVDGIWGPRSMTALSTFRQERGLTSDGVWDLAAQSALLGK